jgi:hypothetical protein
MATQNAVGDWINHGVYRYTVSGLGSADVSSPMDLGGFTERTIQVGGVFTNAVCTIQGRTATDAAWVGLTTPSGGAVAFTACGLLEIQEPVFQVRAVNTTTVSVASDALTTNLKATLFLRSDR